MESLQNPYVLSTLFALAVGLFIYAFFMPRNTDTYSPNLPADAQKNKLLRFAHSLGGEIYASLPQGTSIKQSSDPKLEALMIRSGNPWNLTIGEFKFFQFASAFMGFLLGWVAWFVLSFNTNIAPWYLVPLTTIFGYTIPKMKYNSKAKERDLDFKRQLPEALDLIIISLSGGTTFVEALRSSLPNMQDGVLKNELKDVLRNVDTGKTVSDSLTLFGQRSPNESIRTFIQAVKQANELNTPMGEVLESRAEASREEFFALIHAKTASLSSKMMGVLTPTLIPALLIIVLAPSIGSLIGSIG